jgi:hypothetical protein
MGTMGNKLIAVNIENFINALHMVNIDFFDKNANKIRRYYQENITDGGRSIYKILSLDCSYLRSVHDISEKIVLLKTMILSLSILLEKNIIDPNIIINKNILLNSCIFNGDSVIYQNDRFNKEIWPVYVEYLSIIEKYTYPKTIERLLEIQKKENILLFEYYVITLNIDATILMLSFNWNPNYILGKFTKIRHNRNIGMLLLHMYRHYDDIMTIKKIIKILKILYWHKLEIDYKDSKGRIISDYMCDMKCAKTSTTKDIIIVDDILKINKCPDHLRKNISGFLSEYDYAYM